MRFLLVVTFGTALAFSGPGASACAQSGDVRLQWHDDWSRVRVAEWVTTGVLSVAVVTGDLLIVPDVPRWRGGILMDDWVRTSLVSTTPRGRRTAAIISDVLAHTATYYSSLADATLAAWVLDQNPDVAGNMWGINLLSFAATAFLLEFSKNIVARQRPFVIDCADDPQVDYDCEHPDRYRSFFSGHTAMAFTGASLVCVHHGNLPLYGGGAADDAACIGAMAVAATAGLLRVIADKHYLSDVLMGAIVGIASGIILPSLLHYGFDWNRADGRAP